MIFFVIWWGLFTSSSAMANECTVLVPSNGKAEFHFVGESAKGGAVVIREGRVAAAGAQVDGLVLAGEGKERSASWNGLSCEYFDVSDMVITPGLVAVATQLGAVEVGMEKSSRSETSHSMGDVRAAFQVASGYNPRSTLIPVARRQGITSAVVFPNGGFVAGQAAWADLAGSRRDEAVVDASVSMVASADWMRLAELLDDARLYLRNRSAYDQNRLRAMGVSRMQLEALVPVIQMEQPVVVAVNRAADIEAAIAFQRSQRVRLVLSGAAEGWMMAKELAEAEIPVLLDPLVNSPGSFRSLGGRADNAAKLVEAGVKVILTPYSSHNARTLRQVAGNAVRAGLDHRAALDAMTSVPADVFGARQRGRIEAGAVANIVVWSGDPLELRTSAVRVYIAGKEATRESRQEKLMERYRTLPGSPLPPLPFPE